MLTELIDPMLIIIINSVMLFAISSLLLTYVLIGSFRLMKASNPATFWYTSKSLEIFFFPSLWFIFEFFIFRYVNWISTTNRNKLDFSIFYKFPSPLFIWILSRGFNESIKNDLSFRISEHFKIPTKISITISSSIPILFSWSSSWHVLM